MAQLREIWTTALAAGALIGLPVWAAAQPDHHRERPEPSQQQTAMTPDGADRQQATQHLRKAAEVIERLEDSELSGEVGTQVQQLRAQFDQLKSAYGVHDMTSPVIDSPERPDRVEPGRISDPTVIERNWEPHYAEIDGILTQLLGPDTDTPAPVGTAGVDRPGVAREMDRELDANIERKLIEFRRHLHQFNAAARAADEPQPGVMPEERPDTTPMVPPTETPRPEAPRPEDQPVPERPATPPTGAPSAGERPAGSPTEAPAAQHPMIPEHAPQAEQPPAPPTPHYPTPHHPQTPTEQETPGVTARTDDPAYHINRIRELVNQALAPAPTPEPGEPAEPRPDAPVGTAGVAPGKVMVDRATLEQIRNHLDQLREAMNDRSEQARPPDLR
jgi:hypothetical protein